MTDTTTTNLDVTTMSEDEMRALLLDLTQRAKGAKAEAAKQTDRQAKQRVSKVQRLTDLRDGTNDHGNNPRLRHNPGLFPESVRPASEDEEISGKPAKGWVVTTRCTDCNEDRLVNTQDAFQTSRCAVCKKILRSASAKDKRAAAKAALTEEERSQIAELTPDQIAEQIAAAQAELAKLAA